MLYIGDLVHFIDRNFTRVIAYNGPHGLDERLLPVCILACYTDGLVSSDVHLNRAERDRLDAMFAAAAPSDTTIDEDAVTHTTNGIGLLQSSNVQT